MKPAIVFIHGMFMNGASWTNWVSLFESRGYTCVAPSWPGRTDNAKASRDSVSPALTTLRLGDIVSQYRAVVSTLRDAGHPVSLVGHSMGGLVAQLLMQEALASLAVLISSAPPAGIRSFAWSHLKSNSALLWPGASAIIPSASWFRYAFANVQPESEVSSLFETFCVPESRLVGKAPLGAEASLDFAKMKGRMHFIAGADDHIIPQSLVRRNFERYQGAQANVTFESMARHSHALCIESRWKEAADLTLKALAS
jgi:pimeloyl-ACP methyl ester carboxylesterase